MVTKTDKEGFSERLNQVMDTAGIPKKGEARQKIIGKLFGVTDKGAWKWLNGESIPRYEKLKEINEYFKSTGVTLEWLLSGNPELSPFKHAVNDKKADYLLENKEVKTDFQDDLIEAFKMLTTEQQKNILDIALKTAKENVDIYKKLQSMDKQ